MSSFQSFVYTSHYQVIGVTETWLSPCIYDNEILPSQYTIFRQDRSSRGGGVLLAISKSISASPVSSPPDLEAVSVVCDLNEPLTFCVVYVPPNATDRYHSCLRNYLTHLVSISINVIFMGDFNYSDVSWDRLDGCTQASHLFCDLLFDLNLHQLVNVPTHVQGNTLDLVVTNLHNRITSLTVTQDTHYFINTDHFLVSFNIAQCSTPATLIPASIVRDFSKADLEGLCLYLFDFDFSPCFISTDVEFVWSFIRDTIYKGFDLFVPSVRLKSKAYPKWFSSDIIHNCKRLRTMKRSNRQPSAYKLSKIESLEKSLRQSIEQAKAEYQSNLIMSHSKSNPSKIYKHIRSITNSFEIPSTVHFDSFSSSSSRDMAMLFNRYFHSVYTPNISSFPSRCDLPPVPNSLQSISISDIDVFEGLSSLDPSKARGIDDIGPQILKSCALGLYAPLHHLFELSLSNGIIPAQWSVHVITPIHKSGDRSSVKNYRPISLLCTVSKVLERIVYDKIIDFLTPSISLHQFGFLSKRSTVQQLLIFLHNIFSSFTANSQTDVAYLDFRKAFDSIPHAALLLKLWSIGICGSLWSWFSGYLRSRTQCVTVRGHRSDYLPVLSGVPQGSILGPLLFLVYINDLPTATSSTTLMFADDTKCLRNICSFSDCRLLQNDLLALSEWSTTARLQFNIAKFAILRFCPNDPPFDFPYNIDNSVIASPSSHRDLGIMMSRTLSWSHHYNILCSKAYRTLGLLRRLFSSSCSVQAKKLLYISLVRSQLTFCSPIWRPHLLKDIKSLERIQRRATKFILSDRSKDYKSRLVTLTLFPLMYFFEMNDIFLFITCLKDPPSNFNILNYVSFSQNSTRSGSSNKLTHTSSSSATTRFFYFNRLPLLWNSLPPLNLDEPLSTLKSQVRKHLWNHFMSHFDHLDPCSYHYLCPCSKCHFTPRPALLT